VRCLRLCRAVLELWRRYIFTGLLNHHVSELIEMRGLTLDWHLVGRHTNAPTWRDFAHTFDGSIVACARLFYSGKYVTIGVHIADVEYSLVCDMSGIALPPKRHYQLAAYGHTPDGDNLDLGVPFADAESLRQLLWRK